MFSKIEDKRISIGKMTVDGASFTEINDRPTESARQDRTARMCRLILLHTLRKTMAANGRIAVRMVGKYRRRSLAWS